MIHTPNASVCRSALSISSGTLERPVLKQLSTSHYSVFSQRFFNIMTATCCLTGALDSDLDDSFQTRKNTNWPPPRIIRVAQKSDDLKTIAGVHPAFSGCFHHPICKQSLPSCALETCTFEREPRLLCSHDAGTRGYVNTASNITRCTLRSRDLATLQRLRAYLCLPQPSTISRASPRGGLCIPPGHCLELPSAPWRSTQGENGHGQDPADFEPPGMGDPLLIFQAQGDTSFISQLSDADPPPGTGVASCPGREAGLTRLKGDWLKERRTVTEGLPVHFPGGFLSVTSQKAK